MTSVLSKEERSEDRLLKRPQGLVTKREAETEIGIYTIGETNREMFCVLAAVFADDCMVMLKYKGFSAASPNEHAKLRSFV